MPIYNTIKIECDSKLPERRATDTQTEKPAEFWLFNNLKFGVVLFCNGELFSDFSNVSKLVLGVKECDNGGYPLESDTFEILKEVAAADIGKSLTETQRANGSVHATFAIEAGDIAATMKAGMKWLVVQAVDSSGGALTVFGGNILCKNDASSGTASGTALTRFEDYKTACETAKTSAASSATQAAASAKNAADSATQAGDYAVQATNSQTAAAQSATTAGVMADAAEAYAVQAATANTSATEKAGAAASSATAAQQAAAQATAISDPEGWRTATRGLISDLAAGKVDVGTFHFGTAGGALQTSGNPMYGVLDQSHCITFELDEDWSIPTSVAASLNMFGDNFYESGYRGIGAAFSTTGRISVRVGDGSSNGGTFQYTPLLWQIFGGSNEMIIPAGKYAVCFCIHFGDTTQDSDGNYLNPSTCKVYTNGVYKCACGQLKHKVDDAWVVFGASEVVWSQNSKLGFFDTTNFHKTDSTDFGYGHYEGKANRFAVFNFDMSASDAPYTPGDYASGKKIPLALCSSTAEKRCILASADYAIARNSTTRLVKDISGNGNDLTVCGDVVGDKDAAVAAFIDELKTQISQTTTNS